MAQAAKKETHRYPTLYQKLDCALLRTPLLPVESYLGFGGSGQALGDGPSLLPADPLVRQALATGSRSLFEALERTSLGDKKAPRLTAKLRRFLVRMSTRPTPYGAFAGVALVGWSKDTDVVLDGPPRTRTRLDMDWLVQYVLNLEAQPAIRNQLRWMANLSAWIRQGRFHVSEHVSSRGHMSSGASVAATSAVRQALELARTPIAYRDLTDKLIANVPSATREKVERLLQQLWELGFLQAELMPPMTVEDPCDWVRERLSVISGGKALCVQLDALTRTIRACDTVPSEEVPSAQRRAAAHASLVLPVETDSPLQIDMAVGLSGGRITTAVAVEAARIAEVLLRLTPFPSGLPHVAGYRQAFVGRYGYDREVALLELLHPDWGLGPIGQHTSQGGASVDWQRAAHRMQTLQHLALDAMREGRLTVELDELFLRQLETHQPVADFAPPSIDLNVFVLGASPAAIDSGEFQLLVGPNLGAMAAGRNLGRFAYLLGSDATAALKHAAQREEALRPHCIVAEISYLPRKFRSANVTVRPAVRSYEVVHGVSPGVDAQHVIPFDELVVGVRDGRFYVRWPRHNTEVRFASGHMLNWMQSPPECRLLSEIDQDGIAQLSSFDWGPATGFPFLPRVQSGRSILHCAQWRLEPFIRHGEAPVDKKAAFADWFHYWRERWLVPCRVYLTSADNRLLYDLEDAEQVDELRGELNRARAQGQCLLQEALPAPEHAWLNSKNGGHHIVELVVSLGLRKMASETSGRAAGSNGWHPSPVVAQELRLRTPGSDWLFLKLYGPRTGEDDLITGRIREFCDEIHSTQIADQWFFVRYADPDPHLRLRFHGVPEQLTSILFPKLCAWASRLVGDGVCHKFAFDTYEREVERYGGPEGATASEAIFSADSRAVVALLDGARRMDRALLALASTDDLLTALGLEPEAKMGWLKEMVTSRREFGDEYRARRDELVGVLLEPMRLGPVHQVLSLRTDAIQQPVSVLVRLDEEGNLTHPLSMLYSSYVHMHLNRLSSDPNVERRVMTLLLRARNSIFCHLESAPASPPASAGA